LDWQLSFYECMKEGVLIGDECGAYEPSYKV